VDVSFQQPLPRIPEQYQVVALLGEGGMGAVYKARNVFTNAFVAIKVIRADRATDTMLQRFQREATAASALNHPNAVKVTDFGLLDGNPYLVMEFVDGESLENKVLRDGPLQESEAVRIFTDVTAALARAHSIGVVHRDLKPANILVTQGPNGESAKILDFGIARFVDANEIKALTQTGEVFGTPLYMSPEQLRGEAADARSDIYAFGAVMYRCLTGVLPHDGDTAYEIMFKRLAEKPPSFTQLGRTNIPAGLERIIFRCLELDPRDRYRNASDLAIDLETYKSSRLLGKAVLPDLNDVSSASRKAIRRHKSLLIGGVITAVLLTSAGALLLPGLMKGLHRQKEFSAIHGLIDKADKDYDTGQTVAAEKEYREALDSIERDPTLTTKLDRIVCYEQASRCADKNRDYDGELRFIDSLLLSGEQLEQIPFWESKRNAALDQVLDIAGKAQRRNDFATAAKYYSLAWSSLGAMANEETEIKCYNNDLNLAESLQRIGRTGDAIEYAKEGITFELKRIKKKGGTTDPRFQYGKASQLYELIADIYQKQGGHEQEELDARLEAEKVVQLSTNQSNSYALWGRNRLIEMLLDRHELEQINTLLKEQQDGIHNYKEFDGDLLSAWTSKWQGDEDVQKHETSKAVQSYRQSWKILTNSVLISTPPGLGLAHSLFAAAGKLAPEDVQAMRSSYEKCAKKYRFHQSLSAQN
jgi:serine/threonine protein kinase